MKKWKLPLLSVLIFLISSCNSSAPGEVVLNQITQDANGVQLSWSASSDQAFQSYKVYRHKSSGIDQSTGNLIHVETDINGTSFTDSDIDYSETYYYRIYVTSDNGVSPGSNIESISTQTISLVSNGSFESGVTVPTDWSLVENNINEPQNDISIDNTTAADSAQSLRFYHNSSTGCWEQWIDQNVALSDLTPNGTYEFSFNYKSNTTFNQSGMGFRLYNGSYTVNIQIPLPTFPGDDVWYSYSSQFVLPDNLGSTDLTLSLHFCNQGIGYWWIDNVAVEKI
ncbi:MAG: fibronectin type III domain-containing protein [Crocinitomicaceae bacterium]